MKITYFILLVILISGVVYSQGIIISEYYNLRNNPRGEWVELIVTSNNLDLRGYILRDNSGSTPPPNNWRGGIRFKNIPFWQGLHSGTIIVINFRGDSIIDAEKSDGYIELGAENDYFFEKICYYCPQGWNINALNIAEASDLLQILDPDGNNIHSLAHMPFESGDFTNIIGHKLSAASGMTNETSLSVVPGQSLLDYSGGFDATASKTSISSFVTKGLPNNSLGKMNVNQAFWKKLRMPIWNNYRVINGRVEQDYVYLSWMHTDDKLPLDTIIGYMIVRSLAYYKNNIELPEDGRIYNIGTQLGSSIVIAQTSSNNFIDNYELQCGEQYIYRVYAYKFKSDDLNFDSNPLNRRGRIYNIENYAEIQLGKDTIESKNIIVEMGNNIICTGDTVRIKIDGETKASYKYDWLKNGALFKSDAKYVDVFESGRYRLRITSSQGCEYLSNEIQIFTKDKPIAEIFVNGTKAENDTIIFLCDGENLELRVNGGNNYKWFKDDILFDSSRSLVLINDEGEFYCVLSDEFCSNFTPKVRVFKKNIDFAFDKDTIKLYFEPGISYIDTVFRLINQSNNDILIKKQNFIIPTGIEIISPIDNELIIKSGDNIDIVIRCLADFFSSSLKTVIYADCGKEQILNLILEREKEEIVTSNIFYDFGNYLHCQFEYKDTLITLYNISHIPLVIEQIVVDSPFKIQPIDLPIILKSKDSLVINCFIANPIIGKYQREMQVKYFFDSDTLNLNTLTLKLLVEINNVDFELLKDTLFFSLPECTNSDEQIIFIKNTGDDEIIISKQSENKNYKFVNLPLIIRPDTEEALLIQFKPQESYHYAIDSLYIIADQCDLVKKIYTNTQRFNYDYVWDWDNNYEAKLSKCNDPIYFEIRNRLILNGIYNQTASINNIIIQTSNPTELHLNIEKGYFLTDTNEIIITLNIEEVENYRGKILFEVLPCYDTLSISYDITVDYAILHFESRDVEFTDCEVGDFQIVNLGIINNSITDIFIDSIKIQDSIFNTKNITPILIPSQGNNSIEFTFAPSFNGEFRSKATFYQSYPCNQEYEINLSGKATIQSDTNKVLISIPSIKSNAGEIIKIPLRITAIPPFDLSQANIVAIELNLRFNPKLFNLTNVLPGSVFMLKSPYITLLHHTKGDVTIMIDQIDPNMLNNGEYLVIVGETLIGDTSSTGLILVTAIFYADYPIVYDKIDGQITIIGDCAFNQRLVHVGGEFKFEVIAINESEIEINFSVISNEESSIKIYEINGILLDLIKPKYSKIGINSLKYDFSPYPSGIYYIVYQHGTLTKTNKFIHIK